MSNKTGSPYAMIAALMGADLLLDATVRGITSYNEAARDFVERTKPATESVADFAAKAISAGFSVWAAIPQTDGDVKFGPVGDKGSEEPIAAVVLN